MKTTMLAALSAATLLAAAAPALAQDGYAQAWNGQGWNGQGWSGQGWNPAWGHGPVRAPDGCGFGRGWCAPPAGDDLRQRVDQMGRWVGAGREQGWLSPYDARSAYGELHAVGDRLQQTRWREGGGLDDGTRYALTTRLDHLADRLRQERQAAW